MKVGRVTLSDRASTEASNDASELEIEHVVQAVFAETIEFIRALQLDDQEQVQNALVKMTDDEHCRLIITTGGAGPSPHDIMPEAIWAVISKELPGFGEIMRMNSYMRAKTAILSRCTAGIRDQSLIINLPSRPAAISECLNLLGPAIVECLDHIAGFRPRLVARGSTQSIPKF
jgi:molybdopterin adenylyltransferase